MQANPFVSKKCILSFLILQEERLVRELRKVEKAYVGKGDSRVDL